LCAARPPQYLTTAAELARVRFGLPDGLF